MGSDNTRSDEADSDPFEHLKHLKPLKQKPEALLNVYTGFNVQMGPSKHLKRL